MYSFEFADFHELDRLMNSSSAAPAAADDQRFDTIVIPNHLVIRDSIGRIPDA